MRIISKPRGRGKTTEVVDLLLHNPDWVAVVPYESHAHYLRNMLLEKIAASGLEVNERVHREVESRVFTVSRLQRGSTRVTLRERTVVVDELDAVLEALLGTHVEVGTITETTTS